MEEGGSEAVVWWESDGFHGNAQVQAALGLFFAAPPPRPGVLAGRNRARARRAADARVVLIVERVVRHLMLSHVRLDLLKGPARERVDLDEAEAPIPSDDRRVRAFGRLVAPNGGDPRAVVGERRLQRPHFPEIAAPVGLTLPQR